MKISRTKIIAKRTTKLSHFAHSVRVDGPSEVYTSSRWMDCRIIEDRSHNLCLLRLLLQRIETLWKRQGKQRMRDTFCGKCLIATSWTTTAYMSRLFVGSLSQKYNSSGPYVSVDMVAANTTSTFIILCLQFLLTCKKYFVVIVI